MLLLLVLDKVALTQVHASEDVSENSSVFFHVALALLRATESLWNASSSSSSTSTSCSSSGADGCLFKNKALAAELCSGIRSANHCALWGVHWPRAIDAVIGGAGARGTVDVDNFYGVLEASPPSAGTVFALCVGMRLLSIVGQMYTLVRDPDLFAAHFEALWVLIRILQSYRRRRRRNDGTEDANACVVEAFLRDVACVAGVFVAKASRSIIGVCALAAKEALSPLSKLMGGNNTTITTTTTTTNNNNNSSTAQTTVQSYLTASQNRRKNIKRRESDGPKTAPRRKDSTINSSNINCDDGLPVGVRAELARVVVGALWQSSRVSNALVRRFREGGGYDAFLSCVEAAEMAAEEAEAAEAESKTEEEKEVAGDKKALWALCALLFVVPSPADADAAAATAAALGGTGEQRREVEEIASMQNYDGILVLLRAFICARGEGFKTDLLRVVQAVFTLQIGKTPEQTAWQSKANLFVTLFGQFDALSLENKRRVLGMVDGAAVSFHALAPQELACYCALLDQARSRPSTILLIAEHLTGMLASGAVQRPALVAAGLFPTLVAYIRTPRDLACLARLTDPGEAAAVAQLLRLEPTGAEWGYAVACGIARRLLGLLALFGADSVQVMGMLRDSSQFAALYGLIPIPEVRSAALGVIAAAARVFCRPEHGVIATMIAILQPNGRGAGTFTGDTSVVLMRTAVLDALLDVLTTGQQQQQQDEKSLLLSLSLSKTQKSSAFPSQDASVAFREGNGFTQVLSLIDSFRPLLKPPHPRPGTNDPNNDSNSSNCGGSNAAATEEYVERPDTKECARFHIQLVRVLSAALKGHPENVLYLRQRINFKRFATALAACAEWCCQASPITTTTATPPDMLEELLEVLFGMAVRGPWPLAQALCPACEKVLYAGAARGTLCARCADAAAVDIPEVLVAVTTGVLGAIAGCGGRSTVVPRILADVGRLAGATLGNVEALSAAHMQEHICAHHGWGRLIEKANGDTASLMLAELLHKLCAYDIPDRGNVLRELFGMAHRSSFDTVVLAIAHTMLPQIHESAPINYTVFSRSTGLIGATQTWRVPPVAWPPPRFTVALWVCLHRCGPTTITTTTAAAVYTRPQQQQAQHHNYLHHRYHQSHSGNITIGSNNGNSSSSSSSSLSSPQYGQQIFLLRPGAGAAATAKSSRSAIGGALLKSSPIRLSSQKTSPPLEFATSMATAGPPPSASAAPAIQLVVRGDGTLVLRMPALRADVSASPFQRLGDSELVFSHTQPLEDGRWHHLVLTYVTGYGRRATLYKGRGGGGGSSSTLSMDSPSAERARCCLYVDGVLAEVCPFLFPASPVGAMMMMTGTAGATAAAAATTGLVGTAEQLTLVVGSERSSGKSAGTGASFSSVVGSTGGRLQVSNAFFFAEGVSSGEALVMHALGPTYDGCFRDLDIRSLRHAVVSRTKSGPAVATTQTARPLSSDERTLLLSPASFSLQHLAPRMLAAFVARNLSVAISGEASAEIPAVGIPFTLPATTKTSPKLSGSSSEGSTPLKDSSGIEEEEGADKTVRELCVH